MINKNPETDTGVQPEDQKSKAASHWLLPICAKLVILPLEIPRMRLRVGGVTRLGEFWKDKRQEISHKQDTEEAR